jgi:hypothetical protein
MLDHYVNILFNDVIQNNQKRPNKEDIFALYPPGQLSEVIRLGCSCIKNVHKRREQF